MLEMQQSTQAAQVENRGFAKMSPHSVSLGEDPCLESYNISICISQRVQVSGEDLAARQKRVSNFFGECFVSYPKAIPLPTGVSGLLYIYICI